MQKNNTQPRKIRVIFLSITFDPEPGALRGLPLAKMLNATGDYEIKVLTAVPWYPLGKTYPGYRMKLWQWESMDGIQVLRVPVYPSHDQSALRRILTYVSFMFSAIFIGIPKIGSADIVYYFDNLPTTGLVAWLLRIFRGTKMVQHIGDMWPESVTESGMIKNQTLNTMLDKIIGGWCKYLYARHERITVLSPGFKRLLIERGVQPDKVDIIYNWADEGLFFPVPYDSTLAQQLGFSGKFNVLYAGNIGVLQSIDTLVRAAHLLKDHPNIQIVIAGTGPREEEIRSLSRELGTSILFLGHRSREEMNRMNALADALIVHLKDIPFLRSTIPSKTQVALASGRPVLMGVKGDAADVIRSAQAGLIFEQENSEDLARAIEEHMERSVVRRAPRSREGRTFCRCPQPYRGLRQNVRQPSTA